ncbi:hypothetical protein [Agrobacterium bohemicum]|uniref:hypothetical protein n=1 Tax=Agrobacterium bohemicum TaxID=2052828 RepID=UPI0012FFFDC3|nr:hypothetical protein [Agrobacterium bohemicum]
MSRLQSGDGDFSPSPDQVKSIEQFCSHLTAVSHAFFHMVANWQLLARDEYEREQLLGGIRDVQGAGKLTSPYIATGYRLAPNRDA